MSTVCRAVGLRARGPPFLHDVRNGVRAAYHVLRREGFSRRVPLRGPTLPLAITNATVGAQSGTLDPERVTVGLIIPGSPPPRASIRTQTSKGRDIANEQNDEISPSELAIFKDLYRQYSLTSKVRSDPCPRYNCHGMTFATSRTSIPESSEVRAILVDDGYIEVRVEDVLPGDVILYIDDSGDIEHSGVVVQAPSDSELKVPIVCSKWGKGSEVVHPGNHCPYNFAGAKYYRVKP